MTKLMTKCHTTFSFILQIHKKLNRDDVDKIYKQIIKLADFKNIIKEFLDNRIYTLISDRKFRDKMNRKADLFVHVNEK